METNIEALVNLFKTGGMQIYTEAFKDINQKVRMALIEWLKTDGWADVPIEDIIGDSCEIAEFNRKDKVFVFNVDYDGSDTGTDPCYGTILFSFDETNAKYLFDNVECASLNDKKPL